MRSCPVCQSQCRDLLHTTPTGQTINCCVGCGMVYADDSPTMNYSKNSIYTCAETYQSQKAHYDTIVKTCQMAGVTKDKSILDVGCAVGGLMKSFETAGFRYVGGVSPSQGEVNECIAQGLMASVRDVVTWEHPIQFDLVTLSHVLEHIPDVSAFLCGLRRWVKPEGRIYVEVPDATRYTECFTGICQGFNSEHINHFSGMHLVEALRRAGFHVELSGAYIMPIERTDSTYPCVWVMATPSLVDVWLRRCVEAYRDELVPQIERISTKLQQAFTGEFVIWGMGETARMLIEGGLIRSEAALAGCDTNPVYHNEFVHGVFVYPPEKFNPPPDMPILICSQTRKHEITAQIRKLGLTNRIITLED